MHRCGLGSEMTHMCPARRWRTAHAIRRRTRPLLMAPALARGCYVQAGASVPWRLRPPSCHIRIARGGSALLRMGRKGAAQRPRDARDSGCHAPDSHTHACHTHAHTTHTHTHARCARSRAPQEHALDSRMTESRWLADDVGCVRSACPGATNGSTRRRAPTAAPTPGATPRTRCGVRRPL